MTDYLLGVLTIPIGITALAAAIFAWRTLARVGAKILAAAVYRIGPLDTREQARLAAAVYGSERGIVVGVNRLGIAVWCGLDTDKVRDARAKLDPPRSLRTLRVSDDFRARTAPTTGDDA